MAALLQSVTVGSGSAKLSFRNRIIMGALTRNRCIDNFKPGPAQVKHYADRARHGTGLIVSEGVFVDWTGSEWPCAPVMVTDDHATAWRKVTDAVHAEGGLMLMQAWHAGRVQNECGGSMSNTSVQVLAPSNIPATSGKYRHIPGEPGHTNKLTVIDDPRTVLETYRRSFYLAKQARFDGIEILAQGGYLPHQFLLTRSNTRADSYGGTVENRCRFLLELVDVASQVYDPSRICVKICPADIHNDSLTTYAEMQSTYRHLIPQLVKRNVGMVCISRRGAHFDADFAQISGVLARPGGEEFALPEGYDPVSDFGGLVKFEGSPTLLVGNHGYSPEEAERLVTESKMDMVQFARPFMFNPDLVTRIHDGTPLATNDRGSSVAYGPYESPDENYNDWPAAIV